MRARVRLSPVSRPLQTVAQNLEVVRDLCVVVYLVFGGLGGVSIICFVESGVCLMLAIPPTLRSPSQKERLVVQNCSSY